MKIYTFDEMTILVREYGDSLTHVKENPMKAMKIYTVLEEYNRMAKESNEKNIR